MEMTTQLKNRKKNPRKPHSANTVDIQTWPFHFNILENKYFQVGQRYSNDRAKRDKWSDAEEEDDEDKSLILGKYKYLEEVPREVRSSF